MLGDALLHQLPHAFGTHLSSEGVGLANLIKLCLPHC